MGLLDSVLCRALHAIAVPTDKITSNNYYMLICTRSVIWNKRLQMADRHASCRNGDNGTLAFKRRNLVKDINRYQLQASSNLNSLRDRENTNGNLSKHYDSIIFGILAIITCKQLESLRVGKST